MLTITLSKAFGVSIDNKASAKRCFAKFVLFQIKRMDFTFHPLLVQ